MASKSSDWQPGPSVCRCCLGEGCYKDISTEYFWMGKREVYAEMLTQTLDLEIAFSQNKGPNSNSRLICESCISRLRDATEFKRQVQECEKTFMQHLDIEKDPDPIYADTEEQKDVKLECVKEEQLLSDDDDDRYVPPDFPDDDDDDLDDEPLTKLVRKVPKKESIDMIEEFLDEDDDEKPVVVLKRKSTTKNKASSAKKSKVAKKTSDTATASKAKPEKKKKDTHKAGQLSGNWELSVSERENAANLVIFTTLTAFLYVLYPLRFKCFYCKENYSELDKLLDHTIGHDVPKREALLKSALRKGKGIIKVDISNLKCRLCDKEHDDLDKIRQHLISDHKKSFTEAGNGMIAFNLTKQNGFLSCHICKEKFQSFFQLNRHISVHYNHHICDVCGKSFVSKTRLKQHLNTHPMSQLKCVECQIEFLSVTKLQYHNRKVHEKKPRAKYKCHMCSEVFEYHYGKMKHLSTVHKINYSFNCETCKLEFKDRKSLRLHTTRFHTLSISCEVCKKPFSERSNLRKHMTMHTEERNFRCPLCTKKYRYERNLKVHITKVHNPDWKFACAKCKTGFSNKMKYKNHVKEKHST